MEDGSYAGKFYTTGDDVGGNQYTIFGFVVFVGDNCASRLGGPCIEDLYGDLGYVGEAGEDVAVEFGVCDGGGEDNGFEEIKANNYSLFIDGANHGWGDRGEGWHIDEVLEDTFVGA